MIRSHRSPRVSASGEINADDFKAIIFDCDGTLVDTGEVHFTAISTALAEIGVTMERDWYRARFGLSAADLLGALRLRDRADAADPRFLQRTQALYRLNLHKVREIDFVAAAARRYKGVVPTAVASGGQREIVETTLEAVGLLPLFDLIVTIEDFGRGKPAPDLFELAARRLLIDPIECLVFEDTDEGPEAARAADMRAIDVREYRY